MMSASSQLITQKAKQQQQRHMLNPLARFDGIPLSLFPKVKMTDMSSSGSKSSRNSGNGKANSVSNSKSPPQQVLKQISGTHTIITDSMIKNEEVSKESENGKEESSNDGNCIQGQASSQGAGKSASKADTVSLFPKNNDSIKRDLIPKQSSSAQRNKSQQQESKVKQEETLSESTTSSNTQALESNTHDKEIARQLNLYLENPKSGLPMVSAVNNIIGFVRNQALFSKVQQKNNLGGPSQSAAQSSMISDTQQTISSNSIPFAHQSKFFALDFKPLQLPMIMVGTGMSNSRLSAAQKKRKAAAAAQNMHTATILPNGTRIPDIQEWFNTLSIDDRVLCLTVIDDFFAKSIIEMQSKLSKKGHGMFKFQSRVIKGASLKGTNMSSNEDAFIKQDFQYQSMKAIMEQNKDQLLLQSKQIHEKEFLDYVRLTYTEINQEKQNIGVSSLNTVTVAPSLVQQPSKMFELISSIVGQNFLKIPYDISMDDFTCRFNTRTPIWFDASEPKSLAYWIIFYIETSMWIHYLSYVRGQFRSNDLQDSINRAIFVDKEVQLINVKNELGPFWQQISTSETSHQLVKEIGQELYQRSQKLDLRAQGNQSLISQLNGGLSDIAINGKEAQTSSRIMEVLINFQEPQKFMSELCMVSISRLDDLTIYLLNQIFCEILREKQLISAKLGAQTSTNPKNKKKKDKKKRQKLQQLKMQQTQNQNEDSSQSDNEDVDQSLKTPSQIPPPKIESKSMFIEEEKKEIPPNRNQVLSYSSSSSQSEDEGTQEACNRNRSSRQDEDFCSNEHLISIKKNHSPKNERDKSAIDMILQELRFDEEVQSSKQQDQLKNLLQQQKEQTKQLPEVKDQDDHLIQQQCDISDQQLQAELIEQQNLDESKGKTHEPQQQRKKAQPKKPRNQWRRTAAPTNNQERDPSPVINTIQIIRSQKPTANEEETQVAKKQKKKKRSKAVGPGQSNNQNLNNKDAASSVLNNFIRTIIQSEVNEEGVEETVTNTISNNKEQVIETQKGTSKRQQYNRRQEGEQMPVINRYQERIPQRNHQKVNRHISIKEKEIALKDDQYESMEQKMESNQQVRPIYVKKGTSLNQNLILQEEVKEPMRSLSTKRLNLEDSSSQKQSPEMSEPSIIGLDKSLSVPYVPVRLSSLDGHLQSNEVQETHSNMQEYYKNSASSQRKKTYTSNTKRKNPGSQSSKYQKYQNSNQETVHQNDQYFQTSAQGLFDPNLFVGIPGRTMSPGQLPLDSSGFGYPQIFDQQQLVQTIIDQMLRSQMPMMSQTQQLHTFNPDDFQVDETLASSLSPHIDEQASEEYYQMLDMQMVNTVKETDRMLESVRKEREFVVNLIESQVKSTFQNGHASFNLGNSSVVGIKRYGSMASELAIESSDVDLAVVGLDLNGNKDLQIQLMWKLCEQLELFMKTYSTINFIDTATVPVIKLQVDLQKISKNISKYQTGGSHDNNQVSEISEVMRYLGIDITFEDSSSRVNSGIQCISYIQELCLTLPALKPIVIVLKKILQRHSLNQPYSGGLNSYSLVLMTSAFLKRFGQEVQSMSKNLQEILNYYGIYFNPQDTLINQNLDFVPGQMLLGDPMTVIDPHNFMNNVTRSAFRIQDIKGVFCRAFEFLINHHNIYTSQRGCDVQFTEDVIKRLTTEAM